MLILTGLLDSYRSLKDKTLKITFETNEPTPEQLVGLATRLQKFGYIAFKEDEFKTDEKLMLNDLKSDFEETGKTPAQRLRGVLYVAFTQNSEDYTTFNDYYNSKMEKFINHIKNKLDA